MITIRDIQDQVHELKTAQNFTDACPEQQLAFLISEVGEVAREVLRLRSGQDQSSTLLRLGMELYDVIWNACAIALLTGVDLESCIAEKIAINRTRTWKSAVPNDSAGC